MSKVFIDLSMEIHGDMQTFPRVCKPIITELESHEDFATNIGAAAYGVSSLTAHCLLVMGDHIGTHMDSLNHIVKNAPGAHEIPLEYCYGDGVLLDFSKKEVGSGITVEDLEKALAIIDYRIKPLDIVLIMTGAGEYSNEEKYLSNHCGMTRDATIWLIQKGVKVMGIDAPTFDPPVKHMFQRQEFWEAHRVMNEYEYYHLENMVNLGSIPKPYGFLVSVFPIKLRNATGAPVRAVAIIDENSRDV